MSAELRAVLEKYRPDVDGELRLFPSPHDEADNIAELWDALSTALERIGEVERPCPGCGLTLAACYDARRAGKVACCPDCDHRRLAALAQEKPPARAEE